MKQLTCEMCGSTDLMKQDGVFVCQSCGTKYSVEEAKKMMIEGTVDVTGSTVKVDDSTKIQNLFTLARRARNEKNFKDASKYYQEIRLYAPDDWESYFFGICFSEICCTATQIEKAVQAISNSLANLPNLIKDGLSDRERDRAYVQCIESVIIAVETLTDIAKTTLISSGALESDLVLNPVTRRYDVVSPPNSVPEKKTYVCRCKSCDELLLATGAMAEDILHDPESICNFYQGACEAIEKQYIDMGTMYTDEFNKYLNFYKEKIKNYKSLSLKNKYEKYWKEHATEKSALDMEKNALIARAESLNSEIGSLPEVKMELQIEAEIESLIKKKTELGLFKGKEKKALQEQIDALNSRLRTANAAKNNAVTPIQAEIDKINKRVKEIETELTMDR